MNTTLRMAVRSFVAYYPAGSTVGEKVDISPGKVTPGGNWTSFITACREGKPELANGNVDDAHYGCVLGHLMNNSYRLGEKVPFNSKAGRISGDNKDAAEHFQKLHEVMRDGVGIPEDGAEYTSDHGLTFDPKTETHTGDFAKEANVLLKDPNRTGFEIPTADKRCKDARWITTHFDSIGDAIDLEILFVIREGAGLLLSREHCANRVWLGTNLVLPQIRCQQTAIYCSPMVQLSSLIAVVFSAAMEKFFPTGYRNVVSGAEVSSKRELARNEAGKRFLQYIEGIVSVWASIEDHGSDDAVLSGAQSGCRTAPDS